MNPVVAPLILATAAASSAESWKEPAPSTITSTKEVNASDFARFTVQRSFVPLEGGRLLLRLLENPVIEVNPNTLECEVVGWDISLPSGLVQDFQHEMARKFLILFSKADAGVLSPEEKIVWLSILDRIDFTSFCIERAAPHYLEGTLRRMAPECYVDWFDGRTERIDRPISNCFSELEPGDTFGAFVKVGHDNMTLFAERISILERA